MIISALFAAAHGSEVAFDSETSARPNIILITTDDQAESTFTQEIMPETFTDLVRRGTYFTESIAAPPLCCPYRAGLISGLYDHNHGVTRNRPGYSDLRNPQMVLPRFLKGAGYQTGFVGKYLNGTTQALGPAPAPGWDRWFALLDNPSYNGTTVSDDGEVRDLRSDVATTAALNRAATDFIGEAAVADEPFALWLAHYAPHPDREGGGPCAGASFAKADQADFDRIADLQMPQTPDLDEVDRSDKPEIVREVGPLTREERAIEEKAWSCAAAALQEVDRGIDLLIDQLRESGELESTIIIFGSDNGMNYGHHGLTGKLGIYRQMLQVPLVVRPVQADSARPGSTRRDELVSQVDLLPTLLELAGAEPCIGERCTRMDGRSLMPLLAGDSASWPQDRGIPIRLGDCRISAYQTPDTMFGRYLRKEPNCTEESVEIYDLEADPFQLENIAADDSAATESYRERLFELERCSGVRGRDPEPPEGSFFCD